MIAVVSATVDGLSDTARAIPKSITFTWPASVTIDVAGLDVAVDHAGAVGVLQASRMPSV